MELNEWIKAARHAMGKNQSEFGDLFGVGKSNVSHWEHGSHNASYVQVLRIAAASSQPLPLIEGVALPPANLSPKAWDLAKALDAIQDDKRRDAAYALCLNNVEVLSQLDADETQSQHAIPHPF